MAPMAGDVSTEAIRDYFLTSSTGRAEPDRPSPLFAGRESAIDAIMGSAEKLLRATGPKANLSTVVHGAPGSGKSELLLQLRERLTAREAGDPPIVVVSGGAELLTEAAVFAEALGKQIAPNLLDRLRNKVGLPQGANISLGPFGAGYDRKTDELPRSEVARLNKFARDFGKRATRPVIVLMIDEAQTKLRTARHSPETFVLPFHLAEIDLRVLPVYAGLGNTLGELRECGVSRLADGTRHLMRRLKTTEVTGMSDEALYALTGQPMDKVRRWTDEIVTYAQGWPMHLNHALQAVAGRAAPDWTLDESGFSDAMGDAKRKRARYYADRLYACRKLRPEMFPPWATLFDNEASATESDVARALRLSEPDAETLVDQAVKAGLLEPVQPGRYASPIPSLIDYVNALQRSVGHGANGLGDE